MKLRLLLPLMCMLFISVNSYAVHSTSNLTGNVEILEDRIEDNSWLGRTFTKSKNFVKKAMQKASILDNPKRILIFAGLALVAGIVLTLVANFLALSIIGTLSWILYLVGFALVVLWIYTILIRA